jgi:hypothetical protein
MRLGSGRTSEKIARLLGDVQTHAPEARGSVTPCRPSAAGALHIEGLVGTTGDFYDNAVAEFVIGRFRTGVIRCPGLWNGLEGVELATLEWAHWFNNRRPLEPLGCTPPAKFEEALHARWGAA